MTLPTDIMQQCHHYVGQYMEVNTKVLPHTILYLIIPLVLNLFRGDILHTSMWEGVPVVANATVARDAF